MLQVKHLHFYRNGERLLQDLSFKVDAGKALIIRGANGSGKTTLLRTLAGFLTPSAGEIFWQEKNILKQKEVYRDALHYIGHQSGIKLHLTVKENLRLFCKFAGLQTYDPTNLAALQLQAKENTRAYFLSAGEKRKLACAKLMAVPKKLWLLDEPLTALDQTTQTMVTLHMKKHIAQGGMIVMTSHQPIDLPQQHVLDLL